MCRCLGDFFVICGVTKAVKCPFSSGSRAVAPLLQCPLHTGQCGSQKATQMGTYQFAPVQGVKSCARPENLRWGTGTLYILVSLSLWSLKLQTTPLSVPSTGRG